jgi:hypothetical protein
VRDDLPEPTAAGDGLVVRVRASSANPVDNAIAAGMLREMVEHDFPVVLGRDYAGTVEAIGADVEGYAVGDEVFGFLLHANPTVREGSWAELIALTPQLQVAPKPASLDSRRRRSRAAPRSRPWTRSPLREKRSDRRRDWRRRSFAESDLAPRRCHDHRSGARETPTTAQARRHGAWKVMATSPRRSGPPF